MTMPVFKYQSTMPVSRRALWDYHMRPGAFERLIPPWENITLRERQGGIADGGRLVLRLRKGWISVKWVAQHRDYLEGQQFIDDQISGPFRSWSHRHLFLPGNGDHSCLVDEVTYQLPLEPLTAGLNHLAIQPMLERMFRFRHQRTRRDLLRIQSQPGESKTIVLVGPVNDLAQQIACFLSVAGHRVFRIARNRSPGREDRFYFTPYFGTGVSHPLEQAYALIHTVINPGEHPERQELDQAMLEFLIRALRTQHHTPEVVIHLHLPKVSLDHYATNPALEFHRGKQVDTGEQGEALVDQLGSLLPREVHLHFGCMVRRPLGYMIQLLLRLETFLFLKDGAKSPQFLWIAREDAVAAVHHLLFQDGAMGEFAVVSPHAATRADLQQILIKRGFASYTLHRILKVLPWAAPGMPAGMDPQLRAMRRVREVGFRCQVPGLAEAIDLEFDGRFPDDG